METSVAPNATPIKCNEHMGSLSAKLAERDERSLPNEMSVVLNAKLINGGKHGSHLLPNSSNKGGPWSVGSAILGLDLHG